MLASRQRKQRRLLYTFNFRTHACRLLIAAALALAVFALFLLGDATGAMPGLLSPLHAIQVHSKAEDTPTATVASSATPTSTVPAVPPSITLVSPSSAQGPVGAHVTIQGSNFTGTSQSLFGSSQPDCSQSSGTLTTVKPSAGSFITTFVWPPSFPVGIYYICAAGMSSSTAVYQVLTSEPPVLSLSTLSIEVGQPLTIQGRNFAGLATGAIVSLTERGSQGGGGGQPPITLPVTGVVDNNGNFTLTWTVQGPATGTVTISAYADSESSSPAVLQASATVTIQPAATATILASPSTQATTIGGAGTTSSTPTNNSAGSVVLIILLVTGIILAILAIVGIVIYLTIRRRGTQTGQAPAPGYNGYNGYGNYGSYGDTTIQSSSQYPARVPGGEYSGAGQYGWPPATGQVSQWDDVDSQPGPDWQPRPMSGYYPNYNDPKESPRGSVPFGQRGQPQSPIDPWDEPPPAGPGYGTYPRANPGHRGADAPNPDDDQWPDLDTNGFSGGGTQGW